MKNFYRTVEKFQRDFLPEKKRISLNTSNKFPKNSKNILGIFYENLRKF